MKTLFTTLLIFINFLAFAQDPMYISNEKVETGTTATPKKKDETILINTGLDPQEAFVMWGKHLAQSGYAIEESNKDFLTINTKPRDTSKLNYDYTVSSVVDDKGVIKLKMRWKLKSDVFGTPQYYDWFYRNDGFHVLGIMYKDMMQVVNSFGAYPITYSK